MTTHEAVPSTDDSHCAVCRLPIRWQIEPTPDGQDMVYYHDTKEGESD